MAHEAHPVARELLAILTVLFDPATLDRGPQRMALEVNLGRWLPQRLRKSFSRLSDDEIRSVLDHVVDAACRQAGGFKGLHGASSAMAWIWLVARNRALDTIGRKIREAKALENAALREERDRLNERDERFRRELTARIVSLVVAHVERSGSVDAAERIRDFRLGIELIWTPTRHADQLARRGYVDRAHPSEEELRKANQNLYQDRRRGRIRLAKVVSALVSAQVIDEEDAIEFCSINRLPWPPPVAAKSRKADRGSGTPQGSVH